LAGVDSFPLNVLANPAHHSRCQSSNDIPGVFPAHSGYVADPLRNGGVLVAKHVGK
jgi:hypothetical protein